MSGKRRGCFLASSLILVVTSGAVAPVFAADDEIAALRAEIQRLAERLEQLEQDRHQQHEQKVAVAKAAPQQKKPLKVKGDLRYRYEMIDREGREERHRNRIRARVGISGNVNESVKAAVQISTGGDDPVSANQSLDGGFSKKDFGLDLAYVSWQVADNAVITAGKMKNPMHRAGGNGLLWDGDLNPEGVAWQYEANGFFANLAGLYVEERSSSDDSLLFGGQLGVDSDLTEGVDVKAGVGYFVYTNTMGNEPFFDGDDAGNTVVDDMLVNDYKQIELFAELGFDINGTPATFFGDWVQNTEASDEDQGFALGFKIKPGKADLAWIYQDLEADAVIGTFTDSDFGGGGTGASGHIFKAKYPVAKGWTAGLTYFLNDQEPPGSAETDYRRLQADLQFKF